MLICSTSYQGDAMEHGTVKWFNEAKGFGFVSTADGDVFCHIGQRARGEEGVPQQGATIYFERKQGQKGPVAAAWRLSQPATTVPPAKQDTNLEQDRRDGYRPGVMIAFRIRGTHEVMLGRRRGFWTWVHAVLHDEPHDAENWMYSWGVPQGGIEEGETCQQAIWREIGEELGPEWAEQIVGEPKFLFSERATFRVEKDGKVYKGKSLYVFLVEVDVPDHCFDWMYGHRQDEFWTLPTPEFEGGIQFYDLQTARSLINSTQRGPKGTQLIKLFELAQAS